MQWLHPVGSGSGSQMTTTTTLPSLVLSVYFFATHEPMRPELSRSCRGADPHEPQIGAAPTTAAAPASRDWTAGRVLHRDPWARRSSQCRRMRRGWRPCGWRWRRSSLAIRRSWPRFAAVDGHRGGPGGRGRPARGGSLRPVGGNRRPRRGGQASGTSGPCRPARGLPDYGRRAGAGSSPPGGRRPARPADCLLPDARRRGRGASTPPTYGSRGRPRGSPRPQPRQATGGHSDGPGSGCSLAHSRSCGYRMVQLQYEGL